MEEGQQQKEATFEGVARSIVRCLLALSRPLLVLLLVGP